MKTPVLLQGVHLERTVWCLIALGYERLMDAYLLITHPLRAREGDLPDIEMV